MKKLICIMLTTMILLLTACSEEAGRYADSDPVRAAASGLATAKGLNTADNGNITINSPMTISNNLVKLNGNDAYLRLRMVNGKYYEDWNPGAFMGTVWEGGFLFELSDSYGKAITTTDLREYYKEPLTFTGNFNLVFDDYNNDGNMDFTLGQYASSNGITYKLFTIKRDGTVEGLKIREKSELFISSSTGPYSTRLQKYDNISFKEQYYDNAQGRNYETVYEWCDKEFVSTGTREIKLFDGYYDFLSDPAIEPKALLEYIHENISLCSESFAANLLLRLESRQKEYQEQLVNRFYNGDYFKSEFAALDIDDTDQNNIDNIKDPKLRELLTDIGDNGFKLVRVEGGLYPVIDFSIYNEFGRYLPEDLRNYFTLMTTESDNIPGMDGGLIISWNEVIRRALAQEQFLLFYDRSQKWIDVQALFEEYVRFIFFAQPNTPDFDYATRVMDPKLKQSLMDAVGSKGDTPLLKKLNEYIEVLSRNRYKLTDEVDQFKKAAVNELS